jgi:hypothetical protein
MEAVVSDRYLCWFLTPRSDLWFLHSVKRVLAAVDADVASMRRRCRDCRMLQRVFDSHGPSAISDQRSASG